MKTLRKKILVYFTSITTIMMILLIILVRNQIKNTNIPLTMDLNQQIIISKSEEVGSWIKQRISELKVLTENQLLISMDMDKIKPYITQIDKNHEEDYESFAIINKKGHAWVSNNTYIDVNKRPYFQKILAEDLDYLVSEPIISLSNGEPIVVIIHAIRDEKGQTVGYINGAIYISKLSALASEIQIYDGLAWISDENGQIFTKGQRDIDKFISLFQRARYPMGQRLKEGYHIAQDEDGNNVVVLHAPIPNAKGWSLGIHFLEKEMTSDTDRLLEMILIFGFLINTSLILISLFLSSSIVKPIKKLQGLMKNVEEGNLNIKYEDSREDEIGQLGQGFNKMIGQIQNLIDQVYMGEQNKREAELRALQTQIQPHFLYNTLDTIHWMALEHGAEDISDMVEALTTLFRISISRGEELIPYQDEIKHLESYLLVQKVRYEDKLEYQIIGDEELEDYKILKIIIQPLVENAIYHGIKKKRGPGKIFIKVKIIDNEMIIKVRDNGLGIRSEKLKEIRQVLDGTRENTGIGYGMFNVHERLNLMFGQAYGIKIKSQYEKGTTITLNHPLIHKNHMEKPSKETKNVDKE